ncbi:hypothetical protein M1105_13925 [Limibaculum sp. FT325]|nr:hypothetical protein [Limibaculum sediminis]
MLHEGGIDVSNVANRFCWLRFGPVFAAAIWERRIEVMQSVSWRWPPGQKFITINGETHGLSLAGDREGEALESLVPRPRDQGPR